MLLTLSEISLYFSNSSSFLISKDMYLFCLRLLKFPSIFGNLIHNGLVFYQPLYPMKNLASVFLFLPYGGISDIMILLMSILPIAIGFLEEWNFCFSISLPLDFRNCLTISLFSYPGKQNFVIGANSGHFFICWSFLSACHYFDTKKRCFFSCARSLHYTLLDIIYCIKYHRPYTQQSFSFFFLYSFMYSFLYSFMYSFIFCLFSCDILQYWFFFHIFLVFVCLHQTCYSVNFLNTLFFYFFLLQIILCVDLGSLFGVFLCYFENIG